MKTLLITLTLALIIGVTPISKKIIYYPGKIEYTIRGVKASDTTNYKLAIEEYKIRTCRALGFKLKKIEMVDENTIRVFATSYPNEVQSFIVQDHIFE
jgi:hypothetical protein